MAETREFPDAFTDANGMPNAKNSNYQHPSDLQEYNKENVKILTSPFMFSCEGNSTAVAAMMKRVCNVCEEWKVMHPGKIIIR